MTTVVVRRRRRRRARTTARAVAEAAEGADGASAGASGGELGGAGDDPADDVGRRQQRRPRDRHPLAEARGHLVAQGEGVQAAGAREAEDRADHQERGDLGDRRVASSADASDLPRADAVADVRAGQHHGGDERGQRRGDGGSGQGQLERRGAALAEGAQRVHEHGCRGGAADRGPHVAGGHRQPEVGDADHHGQGGPGADAEDARVRQRVAGHALHDRPGDPQGRPGDHCEQRARDALGDRCGTEAVRRAGERGEHVLRGDLAGADDDRQHHQSRQDHDAREQAQRSPPGRPAQQGDGHGRQDAQAEAEASAASSRTVR